MTKKVGGGVKKVDSSAILHRKRCKLEYVPDVLQTILRDMCLTNLWKPGRAGAQTKESLSPVGSDSLVVFLAMHNSPRLATPHSLR